VQSSLKRNTAIGAVVLAAAAFAGGAYAATQDSSANSRQAFLNDVAKRLNVSPQQLSNAMRGASLDRLNAAVASGELTQAQANAIKQRLQQGEIPPLGGLGAPEFHGPSGPEAPGVPEGPGGHEAPGLPGAGPGGPLGAAATYLGLSDSQLFQRLSAGKSLAQVAAAQHKSTTGLEQAMLSAERSRLDKAVAAKEITSAQEQQILTGLSARINQLVNRTGFGSRSRGHMFFGPRFQAPDGPGGPAGAAIAPPLPPAPIGAPKPE
jgi:hypothetical protein